MALSVNTNISSQTAQIGLERSQDNLETSMRRLSTGYRINSAKDDAAGLQISNRLSSQVSGLAVAVRNANDGIAIAQTAEGAMAESTAVLQRLRDLSLQAANDSNDASDRVALNREASQLITELDRISETTTFGGQKLLDGSFKNKNIQVGANANEVIELSVSSVNSKHLGSDSTTAVTFTGFNLKGTAALAPQNLTFNVNGKDTVVAVSADDSAQTLATKVSDTVSQLSAKAKTTVDVTFAALEAGNVELSINGETKSTPFDTDVATTVAKLAAEINGTKYTATADAGKLTITDPSGANMTLQATVAGKGTASAVAKNYANTGDIGTSTDIKGKEVIAKGDIAFMASGSASTIKLSSTGDLATATPTDGTFGGKLPGKMINELDISSYDGAQKAIPVIDAAIADIDTERSTLGAIQNRFQHTIYNLQSIRENVMASHGRIKDTDYASEMSELTRQEVLKQASMSNLARANNAQRDVLYLLK